MKKKPKGKKLKLIFRMRDEGNGKMTAWLIEQDGPAQSGAMHGVMFTELAEQIAKVLQKAGVEIERTKPVSEERKS